MLICPKCSNTDKRYFYKMKGKVRCRKCLSFIGEQVDKKYVVKEGRYNLKYSLTSEQKKASNFILDNVIRKKDCALNAVCGAGKTEIVYDTLQYCLKHKKRVGVAIPRKDVVIELKERISKDFTASVTSVYGGNTNCLQSDIIVFTIHQAFRYINYFDVLIIDEVDAFPFKDDLVLQNILKKCSKTFVYLSATMPKYIENNKDIPKYYLNKRYHGYKIPVPRIVKCFNMIRTVSKMLKKYRDKVVLVYFPTITIQNKIAKKIKCDYLINSTSENRAYLLNEIKGLNKGIVFTTTVLERGVTIKDVQVIVFNCEHKLFDKDTLIQVAGRVGRNKEFNTGDILFVCKHKSKDMKRAIRTIKKSNE